MAISQGAGPHRAWISVGGGEFPIEHGHITQCGARAASRWTATVPMSYPGAEAAFVAAANGGATCTITIEAHGGPTDLVMTGPLLKCVFDYIGRYIIASGQDMGHKLTKVKTVEKFVNKKGSDIVQQWCGRVGLPCQAGSSKLMAGKKLQQDFVKLTDGISLLTGIHLLALYDGARWYTDKRGTFHYEISGTAAAGGSYSVNYQPPSSQHPMRSDALRLSIIVNVQAMEGVSAKFDSWHPYDKQLHNGSAQSGSGGGSANQYITRAPTLQPEQAQQYADSNMKQVSRHQVRVDALCVGDPTIDVTMKLNVNGTDFDGDYQIDTIDHDFGMQGYTMLISASTGFGEGGWDAWGSGEQ